MVTLKYCWTFLMMWTPMNWSNMLSLTVWTFTDDNGNVAKLKLGLALDKPWQTVLVFTLTGIERDCKYVDNFVNYIFNCWIWLFDFELNSTRPRLGLGLWASSRPTGIWLSGLAFWELVFNIFLFKEHIKWHEHFYALYKTNIDCSLIGKLCKITPLVDWRPWAYISRDEVEGNIVAHGLQSPRELFCTISLMSSQYLYIVRQGHVDDLMCYFSE